MDEVKYKQINIALSVFWLIASIGIVILDTQGVISLSRNNALFFGIIIVMFLSFQVVKYFEKKANKK